LWKTYISRVTQAKTIVFLATSIDFSSVVVKFSKAFQDTSIPASKVEGAVQGMYATVARMAVVPLRGGCFEKLLNDEKFVEDGVFTTPSGITTTHIIKWTGVKKNKSARRAYMKKIYQAVVNEFGSISPKKKFTMDVSTVVVENDDIDPLDSDDNNTFDAIDQSDDDDESEDDKNKETSSSSSSSSSSGRIKRIPSSFSLLVGSGAGGGLLLPPTVHHLHKLLNVDEIPSISQNTDVPEDYGVRTFSLFCSILFIRLTDL